MDVSSQRWTSLFQKLRGENVKVAQLSVYQNISTNFASFYNEFSCSIFFLFFFFFQNSCGRKTKNCFVYLLVGVTFLVLIASVAVLYKASVFDR